MSNRRKATRRSLSSSRLPERVTAIASATPWWKCNAIRNAGSAVRLTKRPASPVFMVAVTRVLKRKPTSAPGSDSDLRPCLLDVRITRKRPTRHRYSITSSAPPSNVITIVRSVRRR
jgi:hypothetical protein